MARLPRRTGVAAALASLLALTHPAAGSGPAHPAQFRVGAAVQSLAPSVDVYAGGFGPSAPIRRTAGALQARAMVVDNGHQAVAFAVVDAQGYFAGYQEGSHYGIDSIRTDAAAALRRLGVPITAGAIVVQATHSHSAPTLEGIWGPVPTAYLQQVHDRTVAALVAAGRSARPAYLQWATINAPQLDNITTAQYDSFPGWSQDGQVSVLRALSTSGQETIATYANVPAHPDIVCGACLKMLTADYLGAVREGLDSQLGGVSLLTPATLGREETPVQATAMAQMRWYAAAVRSLLTTALAHPHWVTDPTLAAHSSTVTIPGTNAALLALVAANHAPEAVKQNAFATAGEYPIDRSDALPYQTGNAVTTPLTAVRIGPLAYVSMPGEPFPEVRLNLAAAVHGAAAVIALSKGQDDLGYFYPAWVYPFASAIYPTDQGTFSVAPQAGDQIMQGQLANVSALGFRTDALAVPRPLPADYGQALRPGLQALASPSEADAASSGGTAGVVLQAIYAPADEGGAPLAGPVTWDFGDGTRATSAALSFGGPCPIDVAGSGAGSCPKTAAAFLTHRFRPGSYTVRVSGHDANGRAASWQLPVRIYPPAHLQVVGERGAGRVTYRLREIGGSGNLLAATWRLADGQVRRGLNLTLPASERRPSVSAVDSAGGVAVAAS